VLAAAPARISQPLGLAVAALGAAAAAGSGRAGSRAGGAPAKRGVPDGDGVPPPSASDSEDDSSASLRKRSPGAMGTTGAADGLAPVECALPPAGRPCMGTCSEAACRMLCPAAHQVSEPKQADWHFHQDAPTGSAVLTTQVATVTGYQATVYSTRELLRTGKLWIP
jgi:hypothetical protein